MVYYTKRPAENLLSLVVYYTNRHMENSCAGTGKFLKFYLTTQEYYGIILLTKENKQHNNNTTKGRKNNMILTGKDLFNYRMNKIKRFAFMFASVFVSVSFMALMFIVYG